MFRFHQSTILCRARHAACCRRQLAGPVAFETLCVARDIRVVFCVHRKERKDGREAQRGSSYSQCCVRVLRLNAPTRLFRRQ